VKPSLLPRLLLVVALAVAVGACNRAEAAKHQIDEPATVEPIEGSDLSRVTLTERAVERLGIETVAVAAAGGDLRAVPSGALWLDIEGVFWVYTNPEPNVFVRHAVVVEDDNGRIATLSDGPDLGIKVASVGISELFGTEVGVGK